MSPTCRWTKCSRFIASAMRSRRIGLVECEEVDQYGVVVLDERGKIVGFQEKPPKGTERSKLANTGIYVFSPEIFDRIPANEFYDFGKQVFPALQSAGEAFYGFDAQGAYWSDIGTPAEYRRASYDVMRGVVTHSADARRRDRRFGDAGQATCASKVPVCIGACVRIEDGVAIVGPSILDDGVCVRSGARLERSIVWQDSNIGAGATLRDTVVGRDYDVAHGLVLDDALVATDGTASS